MHDDPTPKPKRPERIHMSYRIGERIMCVKNPAGAWLTGAVPPEGTFPCGAPSRGEIYTVGGLECWNGRNCLRIVEKPTRGVGGVDEGWAEYLFRKLTPAEQCANQEVATALTGMKQTP